MAVADSCPPALSRRYGAKFHIRPAVGCHLRSREASGPALTTFPVKVMVGCGVRPPPLEVRPVTRGGQQRDINDSRANTSRMPMDRFDTLISRLLSHEGGYTPGAGDPGGETNWGISKRAYPNLNIKRLTRDQAIAIYRRDYWERSRADDLPEAVGFQLIDAAVNSGIAQATRWLQKAVGVADDGVIGPITLSAIAKADPSDLVMRFNAERLEFMTRLGHWDRFGRGWARRIAQNLRFGAEDN